MRLLQQVDAAQEGTFAGATGADDADHIASRRFQGHALEHFVTAIAFMQVLDFKFVHAVGSHKNSQSVVEQAPVTQRFAPRHLGQPETGLGITQPFNGKQHPGRTSTHRADPIRQRIDHFKNRVARLDPLTGLAQETDHARVRREQQFGAFERHAFARFVLQVAAIRR